MTDTLFTVLGLPVTGFGLGIAGALLVALGVELAERPLASETSDLARHSTERLAAAVMDLLSERSIRVAHELGAEETAFLLEE